MPTALESFASKYRLKIRRSPDDDNEPIVNGRTGQIYEYSENELGVLFAPGLDKDRRGQGKWTPKTWGNFRRNAESLGMTTRQNGDSDGSLSFDPCNKEQARLAIQIARARAKRRISPKQAAEGAARLAAARQAVQIVGNSHVERILEG